MFRFLLFLSLPVLCGLASAPALADGAALSLAEAEAIALARDEGLLTAQQRADALREDAVAARQLPDPELSAGIENVPVDHFSRSRDGMTMASLGLMQRFPPAGARAARGAQGDARATAEDARAALRALATRRAVRLVYVVLAEAAVRETLLARANDAAREAEALVRAGYAGGSGTQQAVLEAGLERVRLEDRALAAASAVQEARARLSRWLGPDAQRPLSPRLPRSAELPPVPDGPVPDAHPELAVLDAALAQARAEVALAGTAYRPEFALEGRYGERAAHDARGRELPDMASVMATVSLPLFTAQRQDRHLAAARKRLAAARHARTDASRALAAQLEEARALAAQLTQRLALYDRELLARADALERSAVAAVQGGTQGPERIARARVLRIEVEMERLELAAQALRAHVDLAYLGGR